MTVAQLTSEVSALESQVASAQSTLNYWRGQVSVAEQNAQTYAQQIASLRSQLSYLQGKVS